MPAGPPAWFRWTTLALSLIGLGVSIYLTYTHLTESAVAACPDTGAINCTKVTTSPQSMVFGIFPVAELGLAFYVFMVAVTSPWGWRASWPAVRWARLIGVIIGMIFVLYLVYAELFMVNAICLWCTSVHVVTFLLFVLTMFSAAAWGLGRANAE
ncbi:MAG: vitamin K epoxide reductase family protein [Actinobacteria bacterium]|nr:vitamin K epoxide reductase family protein [Actinomycetota bacterium]